ncbi:MAG: hypothetical protein AAFX45_11100 [Pseudomonadota bacterium]
MPLKDNVEPAQRSDDIDRIVDALLENPERVSDIKALLRNKMIAPETVCVVNPVAASVPVDDDSDLDDLWDNVPV